jgi:hypothetical protein
MRKPYYGYARRPNYHAIAALSFGLAFGVIAWAAIWCLVSDLLFR